MTDTGETPDPAALARDWIAIWQSEAAALAVDREVQEGWQRLAGYWAAYWAALAGGVVDAAAGRAGAAPPSGPAPASAASDDGQRGAGQSGVEQSGAEQSGAGADGELERLRARVAELESRLAALIATQDRATQDRATSDRATSDRATSDRATPDRRP